MADAADWSLSRVVCAVALVFAPALSAAVAAWSAPLRAVAMARSAWAMATWPNTPAPLWLALMFSLDATPLRSWSPRLEMRPPNVSTASVSIRTPRPPTPPVGLEPVDDGGEDGLPLSPPWSEDGLPSPLCEDVPRFPLGAIRLWPATSHRA